MSTCLHHGDLIHVGLSGLLLEKEIQKIHLRVFVYARGSPPLFLRVSFWLFLPECERKAVGVLIQSCWHTSLTSRGGGGTCLPHIFLEGGEKQD